MRKMLVAAIVIAGLFMLSACQGKCDRKYIVYDEEKSTPTESYYFCKDEAGIFINLCIGGEGTDNEYLTCCDNPLCINIDH